MRLNKRFPSFLLLIILLVSVFSGLIPPSEKVRGDGATYYVSTTGNDVTGDGSIGNPWRTVQHGVNSISAGNTLYVRAGEYHEKVTINSLNGSVGSWSLISPYPGESVVIRADGIADTYDGIFLIINSSYVRVSHFNLINTKSHGVFIKGRWNNHIWIDNNTIMNTSTSGIYCYYRWGIKTMNNITVENNILYNNNNNNGGYNSNEGLSFSGVQNSVIRYNTIGLQYKECINIKSGCNNVSVHHNNINGSTPGKINHLIGIYIDSYSDIQSNIYVYNNIIWGNTSGIVLAAEVINGKLHDVFIYNNIVNITGTLADYPISISNYSTKIWHIFIYHNTLITNKYKAGYAFRTTNNITNFYDSAIYNNIFQVYKSYYTVAFDKISIANRVSGNITFSNNALYACGSTIRSLWGISLNNGDNAIAANPQFKYYKINSSKQNFRLNYTSPCIDAGNKTINYVLSNDFFGNPRPLGSGYDIGAVEYQLNYSLSNIYPVNNSIEIGVKPTITITINESHGYFFNYTLQENSTGVWVTRSQLNNSVNASIGFTYNGAWRGNTKYYWRLSLKNISTYHNTSYVFTTADIPNVSTNASTNQTNSSVTLHGRVNFSSSNCTVWFEYGTTTKYGNKTTNQTIDIIGDYRNTTFYQTITATAGRMYHYRAVAENISGIGYGFDNTTLIKPTRPHNFSLRLNGSDIEVNWTSFNNDSNVNRTTLVLYKNDAYPEIIYTEEVESGEKTYDDKTYDGYIEGGNTAYATAWNGVSSPVINNTLLRVGEWKPSADYYISRGYVYFDTSSIPENATITSACLRLTRANAYGAANFLVTIQADPTGNRPSIPLTATDYNRLYYTDDLGYRSTTAWGGTGTSANITLNATGLSRINKNGVTRFAVRSHMDIAGTPSTITFATGHVREFASQDHATVEYRPVLYVNYTTPDSIEIKGTVLYNDTGTNATLHDFNFTDTYYFAAYTYINNSNTSTQFYSIDNSTRMITTSTPPSDLEITWRNDTQITLTWVKGTGNTTIVRKTETTPTTPDDGKKIYNGTLQTFTDTGLNESELYYYTAWNWDTITEQYTPFFEVNASGYTRPRNTTGVSSVSGDIFPIFINITWVHGVGSNRTIIRRSNDSQPLTIADGNLVYNGTNDWFNQTILQPAFYTLFAYNETTNLYSIGTNLTDFFVVWVNVYDAYTGANVSNYNLQFTDATGSATLYLENKNNPTFITVDLVPPGPLITLYVSASGYYSNPYIFQNGIIATENYFINVYLQPSTTPSNIPPIEGTNDCILRSLTNSIAISNPAVNAVITTTHTIDEIVSVEIYNDSLYGSYGGWLNVPGSYYTSNSTNVTINHNFIDKNTSQARVTYYYLYCPGQNITTPLYKIRVFEIIETDYTDVHRGVENVLVTIKKYMNTTGQYETISSQLTDANGYINIYLIPNTQYLFNISKTGYVSSDNWWIPPPANTYGQTEEKELRIIRIGTIPGEPTYLLSDYITFTAVRQNSTSTLFTNYTDALANTTDAQLYIYEYDNTTNTWILLYSNTSITSDSFNLNYAANNSRTYIVILHVNHTNFGYFTQTIIIGEYFKPLTTTTRFNALFIANYGSNPFGWSNIVMFFIMLGCFFSFKKRKNTFIIPFLIGFMLLFMNIYIGFETALSTLAGGAIPVLIIILGVLMLLRDRKRIGVEY